MPPCSKCGQRARAAKSRAAAAALLNSPTRAGVLVRYVGVRRGSAPYKISARVYLFGQNRTHSSQIVMDEDVKPLLEKYPRQFLVLPIQHMHKSIGAEILIVQSTKLLTQEQKQILLGNGFVTLGEVLTVTPNYLAELGMDDPMAAQNNIRGAFGLNVEITPEKTETQKELQANG